MTDQRHDPERLPIAVLISGGGTTLKNLIDKIERQQLNVDVRLVVSSRPDAKGLQYANQANIQTLVVQWGDFSQPEAFSRAIFEACRKAGTKLVVMGGFLKHVLIPHDYENRVMNIHPSLIPAFSGHGYYGLNVHRAVLEYGAKVSGCTVHFVDNQYDHGPIILQRTVPVMDDDSPESLQARIYVEECKAYPEALQLYAMGKVRVEGRRVQVL